MVFLEQKSKICIFIWTEFISKTYETPEKLFTPALETSPQKKHRM